MRKFVMVPLAMLVVTALALPAGAGQKSVTLEGEMICAKCTLKEEGRDKCQNVLAVDNDGETSHFYMVGNETNKEFGDTCMVGKQVRVTGSVSHKDGKVWLTATEIVDLKKKG